MSPKADEPSGPYWRIPEWFPDLSSALISSLRDFHSELLRFNGKLNLISHGSEKESDDVHIADSILGAQVVLKNCAASYIYDIGAGNGLPGVVMALLEPDRVFELVESDSRKAEFIKHVCHKLGIGNVKVSCVRFESLKGSEIEAGVCRGFASISKTLLLCNRTFKVGGVFYHFKGSNWHLEVGEIPPQLISLWDPKLLSEYRLPGSKVSRAVVATQKIG